MILKSNFGVAFLFIVPAYLLRQLPCSSYSLEKVLQLLGRRNHRFTNLTFQGLLEAPDVKFIILTPPESTGNFLEF